MLAAIATSSLTRWPPWPTRITKRSSLVRQSKHTLQMALQLRHKAKGPSRQLPRLPRAPLRQHLLCPPASQNTVAAPPSLAAPFSADRPQELIEQFIRLGLDEGIAFTIAMGLQNSQIDRSAGLALSSKGLEAIRREGNVRQSTLENSFPCDFQGLWAAIKQAQESIDALDEGPDASSTRVVLTNQLKEVQQIDQGKRRLLQSDRQYGLTKLRAYQARDTLYKRFAEQLARFIWIDLTAPLQPAFCALGDGCGFGHDGQKNRNPPYAKPLIKFVMAWMEARGYPFLAVWTDEAFSSQCCPDPLCRRPPGVSDDDASWRQELAQAGPCTMENLVFRLHWVRSR